MDTCSPEFSAYWQSERELAGERHGGESAQTLSPSQKVALEELAERVNAGLLLGHHRAKIEFGAHSDVET